MYFLYIFYVLSPVPTITWRKMSGNIPKKARLRKSQAVLEIPNIQLEDSGSYECKAENTRGGTAFRGHLQVYSEYSSASEKLCNQIIKKESSLRFMFALYRIRETEWAGWIISFIVLICKLCQKRLLNE